MPKSKLKPQGYNHHHQIPKSKGGADKGDNIEIMPINRHINLHRFFGNDTPLEQLKRILEFNDKVWSEEFKAKLLLLLKDYTLGKAYKKKAIRDLYKLLSKENI